MIAPETQEAPASETEKNRNLQGVPLQKGQFQKGQSGNPSGRAPGSRNKATLIREAALTERAVGLLNGLMEKAEAGDMPAARLVLRRVLPDAGPGIELPPVQSPREIAKALGAVADATASGEITPAQANALTRTLELQLQALQTADAQERQAAKEIMQAALREGLEEAHEMLLAEQEKEAAEAEARGERAPPEEIVRSPLAKYMATEDWLEITGVGKRLGWTRNSALSLSTSTHALRSRGSPH